MHLTTLSPESKRALQSGSLTKMLIQLNKLKVLYRKGTANNKGSLHRHVIAMEQGLSKHMKQITKLLSSIKDTMSDTRFTEANIYESLCENNDLDTLSMKNMRLRKAVRFTTRKRAKAESALEEEIYKHYYFKLTKLTKMKESLHRPYASPPTVQSNGICRDSNVVKPDHVTLERKNLIPTDNVWNAEAWKDTKFPFDWKVTTGQVDCNSHQTYTTSYKDRFKNLLYKVMVAWKPRDFIQRMCGIEKLHSLCFNIKDHISVCVSPGIDRITNMEKLDSLFKILRRFKISSPVFQVRRVYQGGGPRKCFKHDKSELVHLDKQDAIGKNQLSVKVVNSLSAVLRGQFNLEHGLVNVKKLYKASRIPGPVSQKLAQFHLQPVQIGSNVVQIHYCDNHYVTSEQRSNKIVVWDSLQTSEQFKVELYPQLRLTYDILSQHSNQPEGLITYETDKNNMQKDFISCGIFAVMRAFFILSDTSSKINTDIARSYLSGVLAKQQFTDYDLFSSDCTASKMQVMLENYMSKQKELQVRKSQDPVSGSTRKRKYLEDDSKRKLQSKKLKNAVSDCTRTELQDVTGKSVKKRGRPKKKGSFQQEKKTVSNAMETVSHSVVSSDGTGMLSQDITENSVRKRGRPRKRKYVHKDKKFESDVGETVSHDVAATSVS